MTQSASELVQTTIDKSGMAKWLGFSAQLKNSELAYHLTFNEAHIGNPAIRALHGGAIAAFLEFAAQCELVHRLDTGVAIKTINSDFNYLASSRAQDMDGSAVVTRLGRRIAFVEATGGQQSQDRPVAKAMFRFRIGDS